MIKVIDNYLMPYEYDMIRAYFEGDMDNGTVDGSCNWNFVDGCAQLGDGHFHFNSLIHSASVQHPVHRGGRGAPPPRWL